MSLNSHDYDDINKSTDLSADDNIKRQAEELLKDEYLSFDNSLHWRINRAKLYLNREKRLKEKMQELAEEKATLKEEDLKKIDSLKVQLNDDTIVVNTDRTPVWNINTEDLIEARRNEVEQKDQLERIQSNIVVNTDRTPVWHISTEDLVNDRYDEIKSQIENQK